MVRYSFQSANRYTGYTIGAILKRILSMTSNGLDGKEAYGGKARRVASLIAECWSRRVSVLGLLITLDCLVSQALLLVCYFR